MGEMLSNDLRNFGLIHFHVNNLENKIRSTFSFDMKIFNNAYFSYEGNEFVIAIF